MYTSVMSFAGAVWRYSVRGGTSAYTVRCTRPSASSARSCKVRCTACARWHSWGGANTGRPPRFRHLCVGSPITFSRYEAVRQNQTSLVVDNFQLPELSKAGAFVMGGHVSVNTR